MTQPNLLRQEVKKCSWKNLLVCMPKSGLNLFDWGQYCTILQSKSGIGNPCWQVWLSFSAFQDFKILKVLLGEVWESLYNWLNYSTSHPFWIGCLVYVSLDISNILQNPKFLLGGMCKPWLIWLNLGGWFGWTEMAYVSLGWIGWIELELMHLSFWISIFLKHILF